jgi:ABC-type antimicrobial peptide transport system permease subunit
VPAVQFIVAAQRLVVRTTTPIRSMTAVVRERVQAIDPDVRVMRVAPFVAMFDAPLARPRFNAFLLGFFAIVALFLSTVGHHAVVAASVRQREREIAVRMALGASPWVLRRMVITESLSLSGIGAVLGLAGAFGATRLLRGMLFGVEALDPITLIGAALLLMVSSAVASYAPLRRATQIDAVTVLRS